MNLLIVTQKVDREDENLGFFHRWIEEFARHADSVLVIAGSVGAISFPSNVRIFSLGKESGRRKIFRIFRYWSLFFKLGKRADAVFFHMSPEFVLAAFPFFLFSKKSSSLWYTHKSVTFRLKLAEKMVDYIFTASDLSFRLPSKKIVFTGHGIDTDFFRPDPDYQQSTASLRFLTVGRVSPIKSYEKIIEACALLKDDLRFIYSIVGGPLMPGDEKYVEYLKELIEKHDLKNKVFLRGPVSYSKIIKSYQEHDMFISLSSTGSLDKSVLEAMACGLTIITSNESFKTMLPPQYFLEDKSPKALSRRIRELVGERRPNLLLRSAVVNNHGLTGTIDRICGVITP